MAYNPYSAVNAIYKLKGQWDTANNAGDATKKNDAAAKAQEYYRQLRNNGYGDVADELTAADYTQAKAINDKWATMGKNKTRDYLYTLGQSKGMSKSDMDKIIGWNNLTGEVSLGGKKIGTPDAVVDGVSYWSDTSVLDNAFNDYIERSGTTRSKESLVNQENESLFAKYNQEYEDLKNTNPFTTEEAKAILAKYDLASLQGRDNQVASGSASNGGNIDSFSAANALRQQSALITQGQMAVLEAHQQKLDHARNLLSDMGVNIDRVFNEDETAKNNEVARKSAIAEVTGYAPDEWVASNNPYMNEDGTIKDEYKDVDFSDVMENAKAAGNTEAYNAAATARYYKIMNNYGLYGKYDDGNYILPGQQKTEAARQFDDSMKYNYKLVDTEEAMNTANNTSAENIQAGINKNNIDQINANADAQIKVANATGGSTTKTTGGSTTKTTGGSTTKTTGGSTTKTTSDTEEVMVDGYAFDTRISNERMEACNVGYQGQQMYNGLCTYATQNSGFLTYDEILDYFVTNSTTYQTNKAELEDLCKAMGLPTSILDGVKNNGWAITGGWRKGVSYDD